MKKFLLYTALLLQVTLFAKSEFMKMCENPTDSQLVTINAITENTSTRGVSKDICKRIDKGISEIEYISLFNILGERKNVTDLTPLVYFKQLKRLNISYNSVSDLTPLSNLKNLEELDITDNPIKDLSPLKGLKLKELHVNSNRLVNLVPITAMLELESLSIYGNGQELPDIQQLNKLNNLTILSVKVSSLCRFKNAKKLKSLHLAGNGLSDLTCIENFQELEDFDLRDNPVTDLSSLQSLDKLKKLHFENVPVSDVTPLAKLKSLESFTFYDTEIKYLSPLKESTSLQYITNQNQFKFFTKRFLTGGFQLWYESIGHRSLASCSPETIAEIREGKTCFEEDGILKSWWKRKLGL